MIPRPATLATQWPEGKLEELLDELPLGVVHLRPDATVAHANATADQLLSGPAGAEIRRALCEMVERDPSGIVETVLSLGHLGEVRALAAPAGCLEGHLAVLDRNTVARARAEVQVLRALLATATDNVPSAVAAHRALSTLAATLVGSTYLVLYELDAEGSALRPLTHVNVPPEHAQVLGVRPLTASTSLAARVVETDQPLHVPNLARSFFPFERGLPGGERLGALALPVRARGKTLGCLYLVGKDALLTTGELKLVQGLVDALGTLIEHAQQDVELKARQHALQALMDHLPDAVVERGPDGTILIAGGSTEAVFGLPAEQLAGRKLESFIAPQDLARFGAFLAGAAGASRALVQVSVCRARGELVVCEVSGWTQQRQGVPRVHAVFRDVTERARLEEELRHARNMAIQRDRLAMIGQLSAGVAHEINNPLSFVRANLAMLRDIVADARALALAFAAGTEPRGAEARLSELERELDDMVKDSLEGVDRIVAIVGSLKGMARSRPEERRAFDPRPAVAQAVTFFVGAKRCSEQVQLELSEVPRIHGEPGGLSQVIINLLDNAFDATAGAGRIQVRGGRHGDLVRLSVGDNGPGIDAAARDHIFEPFFTTKGAGKGTGLGLHISHQIVARFGGTLSFDTGPGGTTFHIDLPAAGEAGP